MTLEEKSGDHQHQRDPSSRDHECLYTISRKHQMKIHFTKAQYSFRVSCAVFPPMAAIHRFCFMAMSFFFLQANIESYFFGLTVCQTLAVSFLLVKILIHVSFTSLQCRRRWWPVYLCLLAEHAVRQSVFCLFVMLVSTSLKLSTQSFQTFSLCLF